MDLSFRPSIEARPRQPRVVIVGAGFGGLAAAKALGARGIEVTIVDRQNHHLFQPLLYQVATAGLSPADIAAPIRTILKAYRTVHVLMDEVIGVDRTARVVRTANGAALPYDALVIATGARHSYFGRDAWAAFAPGIKTIDDAIRVRRDVLLAMERAETMRQENPATRETPVTFAVIGGGPTGVEMAGAIAELARHAAEMDFRFISRTCVRVLLIQSASRVLANFSHASSTAALAALRELGVEVVLDRRVTDVCAAGVRLDGEFVPTAGKVWAAGVMASPAAHWLGVEPDRSGRTPVDATLRVAAAEEVYVIGDTAAVVDADGRVVPGVAPAAKQQGAYVARAIHARLANRPAPGPFRYRDAGVLATIGRRRAVIDLPRVRLKGFLAWMLWSTIHLYFLVGFRNRAVVGATWLWNYLTFERGARLITGQPEPKHDARDITSGRTAGATPPERPSAEVSS